MEFENQKAKLSTGRIGWQPLRKQRSFGLNELNFDAAGFIQTQRQSIAANRKFQRVTQWCFSQQLNLFPINQPHFHQANRDRIFTADMRYPCDLAFYDLV